MGQTRKGEFCSWVASLKNPHSIPGSKSCWLQKRRSGDGCSTTVININIARGKELIFNIFIQNVQNLYFLTIKNGIEILEMGKS